MSQDPHLGQGYPYGKGWDGGKGMVEGGEVLEVCRVEGY